MRDGMLLSTGKKYHDRRKIITPAFNFQMMETYAKRFDILGNKFIKKLREFDADAEIEIFHLIGLFALDVICGMSSGIETAKSWQYIVEFFVVETMMGVSMNAMSQPDSDYIRAIIEWVTNLLHLMLSLLL